LHNGVPRVQVSFNPTSIVTRFIGISPLTTLMVDEEGLPATCGSEMEGVSRGAVYTANATATTIPMPTLTTADQKPK
jgi:hypothetical protein